jgi:hypothetical protein
MAGLNPRRFVLWPKDNLTGRSRPSAFAEGVMFTDGTVAVQWAGTVPHTVIYPRHGIEVIQAGAGYLGAADVEFLDPDPYDPYPSPPLPLSESDTGGWSAFRAG